MMIKHDKTTISIFPMIIYAIHWGWLNFLVISPSIIDGSQTPIKPVINPAHHQFPSTIQFFNSKIPLIQLIILDSTSTYSHYTLSFSRVAISYSPHQKTHHKTPIFHPPQPWYTSQSWAPRKSTPPVASWSPRAADSSPSPPRWSPAWPSARRTYARSVALAGCRYTWRHP